MKDLFPFDIIWATRRSPHAPAGTSTPWSENTGGHQACGNTAAGQVPPPSRSHPFIISSQKALRFTWHFALHKKKMAHTRSWIQSAELKSFPPLFPASMCRKPNGPDVLLTDGASRMSITTRRRSVAFTAAWGGNLADGCRANVWGASWAQCPLVADRNTVHVVVRESCAHKNQNTECNYGKIQFGTHRLCHSLERGFREAAV